MGHRIGITRRSFVAGAASLTAAALAGRAAAQDARVVEAAKKEGKVVWYTSLVLTSAEKVAKQFEAAYPGIKCEVHHHEVATGGQCGIAMHAGPLLRTADDLLKCKYVIKEVARRHGKTATFMPGSTKLLMAVSMPPLPVAEMTKVHSLVVPNTLRNMRWFAWLISKK